MPTVNQEGKRLQPSAAKIDTPYWGRVIEMGRGRYHRKDQQFSASAQTRALNANRDVAAHYNVEVRKLMRDTVFVGWFGKFNLYVQANNSFAAHACFQHMEQRAIVVKQYWPKAHEWIQ